MTKGAQAPLSFHLDLYCRPTHSRSKCHEKIALLYRFMFAVGCCSGCVQGKEVSYHANGTTLKAMWRMTMP